ncbi:hypothetical protein ACTI_65070 [Actinoplanes sp. OR16]|nr:hypothetical protein ACTI_65070 [Actinoplanes sp. OR16]
MRFRLSLLLLVGGLLKPPPGWMMSHFKRQPRPNRWYYQCGACEAVRDFARKPRKTPHCKNDGQFMRLIYRPGG